MPTRAEARRRRRRNAIEARRALQAAVPPPHGLVAAAVAAIEAQAATRARERPRKLHVDAVGMLLIDGRISPEQAAALVKLHADAVMACLMPRVTALWERRSPGDGEVVSGRVLDAKRRFSLALTAIGDQRQKEAVQYVALWPGETPVDGVMLQDLRDGADALDDHYERAAAEAERQSLMPKRS